MKTNEAWIKSPRMEDGYEELHKIRPQIYFWVPQEKGINKVKIVYGGKEVILTEVLDKGLTKEAMVEFGGVKILYKSVYDAELEINKLLR